MKGRRTGAASCCQLWSQILTQILCEAEICISQVHNKWKKKIPKIVFPNSVRVRTRQTGAVCVAGVKYLQNAALAPLLTAADEPNVTLIVT